MPFSHHSHSGDFCKHAKDSLETILQTAISRRMHTYAMTEHMPRDQECDLYPEEIAADLTPFDLYRTFDTYYNHSLRLRAKYSPHIHLLLGLEAEYIRPSSIPLIHDLQDTKKFDFVVGSVHHVNAIPIDFDKEMYARAIQSVGRGQLGVVEEYLDAMWVMLTELKPAVVAHFDLIRLLAEEPRKQLSEYGGGVWGRVRRNLETVRAYGGLLEINSAALRKGWDTPYPGRDVCQEWMAMGGRFTLSDDAHSAEQVGLNYGRTIEYAASLGIQRMHYLERLPMGEMAVDVLGACAVRRVSIGELRSWAAQVGTGSGGGGGGMGKR